MIEEKKKYEKPEARAVEIQTEAFIATSGNFDIETTSESNWDK